jgi:tetratricopeptide (TPR) repeat protein
VPPPPAFLERLRQAKLVRVAVVYAGACWGILEVTSLLKTELELPAWLTPVAILLLGIGGVIVLATAWVQSSPQAASRARAEEIPEAWEVDLADMRESVSRGRLPHLTWSRSILGGLVAFALLFGLAGVYVLVKDRGQTFAPSEAVAEAAAPGIAVLPFAVRGEGLDVWREGMVDVLSTNLDGAGGFRAIDSRTVLARWDEGVGGSTRPDLAASLDVARRTGARYAVIGSALATGPDVRFAAEIYDVESGANLGEAQAVGLPDSVLSLVNELSIQVLRALPSSTDGDTPWRAAASQSTASVPALKAYLEGEALYRRADFEGAAAGYRRALESDSTFALAAYRLGDAYGWMENIESDLAHEFLTRAGRNIERLPEREALLVRGVLILDAGSLEALPLFESAVRRYPDDAEAWFLLGDTYVHLGSQALVDWRKESDRALSRAVELDPEFAPYYLHPIERAVTLADSAGARSLFATLTRLVTTASNEIRTYGMGLSLALGDSAEQAQAIAGLDSVDEGSVSIVSRVTNHPRLYPRLARVVEAWRARPDATADAAQWMVLADVIRGRAAGAAGRLRDPLLDAEGRAYAAYRTHLLGPQAGSAAVEETLELPATDDAFAAFYTGALAAEQGRWPDHAKAVARLRTDARQALAAGDTTGGGFHEAAARALEGFGFLRKGDRESALQVLQSAQRQATGYGPPRRVNSTIRWWLGELLLEMDRPREAEPYFTSLVFEVEPDPLAAQRLGLIHERLGDAARARDAYELFVNAWQDADPELQPVVEEARAAARRLGGADRT